MTRMRRLTLVSLVMPLLLAACVTAQDLDARLKTWVGKSGDQLATRWGAPNGNYTKQDGTRILSYDRLGVITTGPGWYAQTYSRHCRVDFYVDKSGKITGASWHGATDQCDRSILSSDDDDLPD
jgi:hypothetical protein